MLQLWQRMGPTPVWSSMGVQEYPHENTGEKPSFLLYSRYLSMPVEAELISPDQPPPPMTTKDYCKQLLQRLASSRQLVETTIRKAQGPGPVQRSIGQESSTTPLQSC